jgi:hypothetical protein
MNNLKSSKHPINLLPVSDFQNPTLIIMCKKEESMHYIVVLLQLAVTIIKLASCLLKIAKHCL